MDKVMLKSEILSKSRECRHGTTFAELRHIERQADDFNSNEGYKMFYKKYKNINFWIFYSKMFREAIDELIMEKKIFFRSVSIMHYLLDGEVLVYPLAKKMRNHQTPVWTPMTVASAEYISDMDGWEAL